MHFYPSKKPQKYNFEKLRNIAGDIILLHMCTKNHNHKINGSWDTEEWGRRNFLSFLNNFFFFYPLMILQTKYLKKFWSATDRIFCHFGHLTDIIFIFHFGLFFALLPLLTIQKSKIKKKKKEKNPCRYYHFTQVHHKWQSYVWFWRYGARRTDGKNDI